MFKVKTIKSLEVRLL